MANEMSFNMISPRTEEEEEEEEEEEKRNEQNLFNYMYMKYIRS
jgi:hypothetical protein